MLGIFNLRLHADRSCLDASIEAGQKMLRLNGDI